MIKRVDKNIDIIDFNHNIQPYNIEQASVVLERSKDIFNDHARWRHCPITIDESLNQAYP